MLLMSTNELRQVRHLFSMRQLCSLAGVKYNNIYDRVIYSGGKQGNLTVEESHALKKAAVAELKKAGFTAADFSEGA